MAAKLYTDTPTLWDFRSAPQLDETNTRTHRVRSILALESNAARTRNSYEISGVDVFGPAYRTKLDANSPVGDKLTETPMSAWLSVESWQMRETIFRTFAEHAYFIHLAPGQKRPAALFYHSKASEKSKSIKVIKTSGKAANWIVTAAPPVVGNYGIVPKPNSRLLVVDLDAPKSLSALDRESYFTDSIDSISNKLGVDLYKESFAQRSQSGGYHFFLLAPDYMDPEQLPTGRFRGIFGSTRDGDDIEGDFRSARSPGYVVAAGSVMENSSGSRSHTEFAATSDVRFKGFKLARKFKLPVLEMSAISSLHRASPSNAATREGFNGLAELRSVDLNQSSDFISKLEASVNSSRSVRYHAKRSFVYRAVSCCGTLEAIADLVSMMRLDWDTYTDSQLAREELLSDLSRNEQKFGRSEAHGGYCYIFGGRKSDAKASSSRAEKPRIKLTRDQLRYLKRDTFSPDLVALMVKLSNGRKKVSQVRQDAFTLAACYFAPITTAGSQSVLGSREFIVKLTGLSNSRVHAALKLLRSVNFIQVKQKPSIGAATVYTVNRAVEDEFLTLAVRRSWGASRVENSKGEAFHLPSVVDYATGYLIRADGHRYTDGSIRMQTEAITGAARDMGFLLPSFSAESLLKQYSVDILSEYESAKKSIDEPSDGVGEPSPNGRVAKFYNRPRRDISLLNPLALHSSRGPKSVRILTLVVDPAKTHAGQSGLDPPWHYCTLQAFSNPP